MWREHLVMEQGITTSSAIPIVFIVDDDVSVRESLELLIRDQELEAGDVRLRKRISTNRESVSRAVLSLTFTSGLERP